jgi:hypothetical protein
MPIIDRIIVGSAIAVLGATVANAQAGAPSGVPGSGDSGKISNSNRENNAAYNHVLATGVKSQDAEDRPASRKLVAAGPAAVDTVDADGAVVNTGQTKIKVPLTAFGKDDQGLMLGITAARFNELVAKAHSSN